MTKSISLFAVSATLMAIAPAYAQTVVTQSGGRLTLATPGDDQSVKIEVGPNAGAVRVFGFPGLADGQQYSGVTGLSVLTGAGKDFVEIAAQTPQNFDIAIDTASGDSEAIVKWKVLSGGASSSATVDLNSDPSGTQIAVVEIDSEAQNAFVTVRAPSATDSTLKVQSSNASTFLRAFLESGARKSVVDVSSSASTTQLDLRGGSASGANEGAYTIQQARPGAVNVNWAVSGSAADDKVEAKLSAAGGTVVQRGFARGLGGSDLIQFETEALSTTTGLAINGGDGNDFLREIVKGRFQLSQTLQTRLLGGNGDDELTLTTDTGIFGTGLPNDLIPVINCGAGIDRFNAFGQIIGCESRL